MKIFFSFNFTNLTNILNVWKKNWKFEKKFENLEKILKVWGKCLKFQKLFSLKIWKKIPKFNKSQIFENKNFEYLRKILKIVLSYVHLNLNACQFTVTMKWIVVNVLTHSKVGTQIIVPKNCLHFWSI